MNIDEVLGKIGDDVELDLGEAGKLKGAELKQHLNGLSGQLKQRDEALAAHRAEVERLKQIEQNSSALFAEAARLAGQPDPNANGNQPPRAAGIAGSLEPADEFEQQYGKDPLFAPYTKGIEQRILRRFEEDRFKPFVEKELKPQLAQYGEMLNGVARLVMDERQRRDFRDLGEWPSDFDFDKARKLGAERGWFLPDGQRYGLVDLPRVHSEVMAPIIREREMKTIKEQAMEEAAKLLRQNGVVLNMPNRAAGAAPQPVKVKGKTTDSIISGALEQAAQDNDTLKLLSGLGR